MFFVNTTSLVNAFYSIDKICDINLFLVFHLFVCLCVCVHINWYLLTSRPCQTIFHDLPRLSLLADDEWMSVEFLMGVAGEEQLPLNTSLLLHNTDASLTGAMPAPWVVKAAGKCGFCLHFLIVLLLWSLRYNRVWFVSCCYVLVPTLLDCPVLGDPWVMIKFRSYATL